MLGKNCVSSYRVEFCISRIVLAEICVDADCFSTNIILPINLDVIIGVEI